jgi:hypothetical protein
MREEGGKGGWMDCLKIKDYLIKVVLRLKEEKGKHGLGRTRISLTVGSFGVEKDTRICISW